MEQNEYASNALLILNVGNDFDSTNNNFYTKQKCRFLYSRIY